MISSLFVCYIFNPIYGKGERERERAKRNEYNINNEKVIAQSVGASFLETWLKVVVYFDAAAAAIDSVVAVVYSIDLFTQNEN